MTADVWEAVIQQWSALQLLIRNSKTGPVWLRDSWMGACSPALTPTPTPTHPRTSAVFSSVIFLTPFVYGETFYLRW